MAKRKFHISDVLSITTGRLVSTRGMEGVADVLNFAAGVPLFTHQLPEAREIVMPIIFEQYPALETVFLESDLDHDEAKITEWVNEKIPTVGVMVELDNEPMVEAVRAHGPFKSLAEMMGR